MLIPDPTQHNTRVSVDDCDVIPCHKSQFVACRHKFGTEWFAANLTTGLTAPLAAHQPLVEAVNFHGALHDYLYEDTSIEVLEQVFGNEATRDVVELCRRPLDEEVICEGIDDPESLRAVFVVGSGGSGKSMAVKEMFAGSGFKVIDQDRHLSRMLDQAGLDPIDIGKLGWQAVQAAKRKSEIERDQYAKMRLGLVIDSTGWAYNRIADPVRQLRALGYDCYMIHVDVTLPTALNRNQARGEAGGRLVPKQYVVDAWQGLKDNADAYRRLFGRYHYIRVSNEQDMTEAEWKTTVGKKLRKLARTIVERSIKNPIGVAWLAQDGDYRSNGHVRKSKATDEAQQMMDVIESICEGTSCPASV